MPELEIRVRDMQEKDILRVLGKYHMFVEDLEFKAYARNPTLLRGG